MTNTLLHYDIPLFIPKVKQSRCIMILREIPNIIDADIKHNSAFKEAKLTILIEGTLTNNEILLLGIAIGTHLS